jgi:tRNA-dihydrouridine synthase C
MDKVKLFLAPMEGVTDWVMRDTLTQLGGIDQCVTEFLRVTVNLHPNKVFRRFCPELMMGSKTRAGVPVFIQLLGGNVEPMAANAARAAELGIAGIDLNFGCPAKTVNRHDGGATLLKCPDRIFNVVKAVRDAVPTSTPVTAKIRLGWDDPSPCLENSKAAAEAGATWLTVHCRTKVAGYKPPAYWEWIPKIKEHISIPVVANGDIFTVEDFKKCREVTGVNEFMIGRAALYDPYLFSKIKQTQPEKVEFRKDVAPLVLGFFNASQDYINGYFATARTKQWLKQLSLKNQDAKNIFDEIKTFKKPNEFYTQLEKQLT